LPDDAFRAVRVAVLVLLFAVRAVAVTLSEPFWLIVGGHAIVVADPPKTVGHRAIG
jgi:hypothetical protein